jgi:AAA domain
VSWQRVNLAAPEYATKTPPPDHLDLFYRGRRHVLSGPPESVKTLLAWIAALDFIRGGRAPAGEPAAVAHVDFEIGPNATRELLTDLGATIDELEQVHYFEPDGPPSADDIAAIIEQSVGLVVIDSAAGAYGVEALDDERRKDAQRFASHWIDPFWRAGVATLLVDHVTKNAETRGRFAIGSERKIGTADVHLGLEIVGKPLGRGGDGLAKIHTHKDRPGWLRRPIAAELELHSHPDTHAITWTLREPTATAGDDFRPTALMEKVSRFLEQQAEPVSRNAVEKAKLGRIEYVRKAMDALVSEGYARESKGANNARLLTHVRPFVQGSSTLVPDEPGGGSSVRPSPYRRDEHEPTDASANNGTAGDEPSDLPPAEIERLADIARTHEATP